MSDPSSSAHPGQDAASAAPQAAPESPWARIKEHKVIQWTLAYLGAGLAVAHAQELLANNFHWPELLGHILIALLIVGLPIAVALAWYHGHRGMTRISAGEMTVVSLLLVIGAGLLVVLVRVPGERDHATPASSQAAAAPAATRAAAWQANPADLPRASIAVLPFLNLSEDKNNGYFADGLSEELIDLLTKVPGLRVPARTSSFYFKDKPATVAQIATTLGVSHVLEGSVRKAGSTLRITAQLVRADNGYDVWSETFDRHVTDVFKIQDEIAGAVVHSLKVSLLGETLPSAEITSSSEAYDLYLRANATARGGRIADFESATRDLERAVQLDERFAVAWASLAYMRVADLNFHSATPYEKACPSAHQAADRAIALAPNLSGAHETKGYILMICEWGWAAAEQEFQRALELDPGNVAALASYATLASNLGRFELELQLGQAAVARDPLNGRAYVALAIAQENVKQFAAAEASWRRVVALDPQSAGLHALLAHALLMVNKPAEALQEAQAEREEEFRLITLPFVLDALGRSSDAEREFAALRAKYPETESLTIAEIYACRGDADNAMAFLDRAFAQHMSLADVPPGGDCLRKLGHDARYQAMLRKMHLPN